MNKFIHNDIHDAYWTALDAVWFHPQFTCAPRGQRVREILNYQFTILNPVPEPIKTHDEERNKVIESYTAKEVELYDSGTNKVEDFAKASKFWNKIANPDGTVNSAYGHLIWHKKSLGNEFEQEHLPCPIHTKYGTGKGSVLRTVTKLRTPWEWAKDSLIADKDTRQALLKFSLAEHLWMGNKDQVCTLEGIFMIREDKLHFSVNMRSNDLTLGLVYDLPWFISLMYKMRDELKETYPNLEIGSYTHLAHSMHIYERDEEKVLKMLGRK